MSKLYREHLHPITPPSTPLPNRERHESTPESESEPHFGPAASSPSLSILNTVLNPFHVRLVLANTGSVARDHLSLERTFLSYVRTSLAISSAGVALVQLFTVSQPEFSGHASNFTFAHQVIRPLGAVMVTYGLIVLLLGTFRFYRIQHSLTRGAFPTSLHGVAGLAFVLGALTTIVFSLLISAKS